MKLIYRGVEYQHTHSEIKTVPTEETGIYRGAKYHRRKIENPPTTAGFATLTYRRAQYRSLRYSSSGTGVPVTASVR
ncbi:MAG: DUF4278 domain-containing protein [Phormidesmis sp.]